jgi:threonine/homoserine/homoserine lactone efflux protein
VFALATLLSLALWTTLGKLASSWLRDARRARLFNGVMAILLVASIVPMVAD